MPKDAWTAEREAALLQQAEAGFSADKVGAPMANPLRKRGRPSLSSGGGPSKVLNARIPSHLYDDVMALSHSSGQSTSDLTRAALDVLVRWTASIQAPAAQPTARRGGSRVATRRPDAAYRAVHQRPRVFVAHGTNDRLSRALIKHLESLDLEVASLDESIPGVTSVQRLEESLSSADIAVVVLTPDDATQTRANVTFEAGYAVGVLGRARVIVLSDPAAGAPHFADGPSVDVTKRRPLIALTHELERLGLVVRANAG